MYFLYPQNGAVYQFSDPNSQFEIFNFSKNFSNENIRKSYYNSSIPESLLEGLISDNPEALRSRIVKVVDRLCEQITLCQAENNAFRTVFCVFFFVFLQW